MNTKFRRCPGKIKIQSPRPSPRKTQRDSPRLTHPGPVLRDATIPGGGCPLDAAQSRPVVFGKLQDPLVATFVAPARGTLRFDLCATRQAASLHYFTLLFALWCWRPDLRSFQNERSLLCVRRLHARHLREIERYVKRGREKDAIRSTVGIPFLTQASWRD